MILSTDHSVPSILRSANPFGTWAQENPGPGTLSTAGTIEELLKWDTPEEASSRSRDTANPASGEASQAASHSAKQQEEQKLGAQTADKSSAKEKGGGGGAGAPSAPEKGTNLLPPPRKKAATAKKPAGVPKPKTSLLTKLMKSAPRKKGTTLKVYVYKTITTPDMKSANFVGVQINDDASVQDVIDATLAHKTFPHTSYPSDCYSMRLMDDAPGIADFDMPSLDRKRQINKFGVKEFCLCLERVPDPSTWNPRQQSRTDTALEARNILQAKGKNFVRILAGEQKYTVSIDSNDKRLADLIPKLRAKRAKLPLYFESIEFVLNDQDRKRLNFSKCNLELSCELSRLPNIGTLMLKKKRFADMGSDEVDSEKSERRRHSYFEPRLARKDTTVDNLGSKSYIFNTVTAAEYKSWVVTKKNKWGMWQKRVLGVSLTQITNNKVEKNTGTDDRSKDVKRSHRNISDVKKVYLNSGDGSRSSQRGVFSIVYDNTSATDAETVMTYETTKPEDAAEIVAKIEYIIKNL